MAQATLKVIEQNSPKLKDKNSNRFLRELIRSFEGTRFFVPSDELTQKFVQRLAELDGRNELHLSLLQQRVLGEQLYLYLATLSKTPEALEGESLNLEKELNEWFGKSIGLSTESLDREILLDMVKEFYEWISNKSTFLADWGKIYSAGENHVVLERIHREITEKAESESERIAFSYS